MKSNPRLNGSDYLMRGFDYELRRHGFAGNLCQIVLRLGSAISAESLRLRLSAVEKDLPILRARSGGVVHPVWVMPRAGATPVEIRTHQDEAGLRERLFNEPLNARRGQLARFDLVQREGGRTDVIFSWSHDVMDAPAAETLVAAIGDEGAPAPAWEPPAPGPRMDWKRRLELIRKSVAQLDKFCEAQPRSLGMRRAGAAPRLRYRLETFSAPETAAIRANGARWCGVLGDAQFHAASAVMELHRLHQRLECATASYILPMPVGLRPKGRPVSLSGNPVDMLMLQFLPGQLGAMETCVQTLKAQTAQALRENSVSNSRLLSELFSFLPLPVYMRVLKHGLRGEICSIFFGDTAAVNPRLENFLGAKVEDFAHIAAVTPGPGLGVIFYYFRGELRLTVVHAETALSESEAGEFAAGLRKRLLQT
jgi:hypothetical protein